MSSYDDQWTDDVVRVDEGLGPYYVPEASVAGWEEDESGGLLWVGPVDGYNAPEYD
jgi:hypothetical protein